MAEGPNDGEWQVGLATHEWNAAEDPVFTGLGTGHQGETPVGGCQGTEPSRRSQHPKARPWHRLHVGVQAEPRRTAGYVTRMPGGVGGVAPRGVPLSRSREPAADARPRGWGLLFLLRVFGRLPVTDSATRSEGRRPKSLRGGNRGGRMRRRWCRSMGI